jgi:hypothetical protein
MLVCWYQYFGVKYCSLFRSEADFTPKDGQLYSWYPPIRLHSIITVLETLGNISRVVIILGRWMSIGRLGRRRHKWEHNIKMDLQEVALGDMNWVDLAQDKDRGRALVNSVTNFQVA